jgi:probable HAF family extracellular repeat protein
MRIRAVLQLLLFAVSGFLPLLAQPMKIGPVGAAFDSAFAINERGNGAGRWEPPARASQAFAYIGGANIETPPLPGKIFGRAQGINNQNQVVGFSFSAPDLSDGRVFLWIDGVLTDMHAAVSLGGSASFAGGINDVGHIAGNSFTSGDAQDHAFLYRGGTSVDLGTLGGAFSFANAVNSGDTVVGASLLAGNSAAHAFSWNQRMVDFGGLGGSYSEARAINNSGVIAGFGVGSRRRGATRLPV